MGRIHDEELEVIRQAERKAVIDRVLEIIVEKWKECDYRFGEMMEIRAANKVANDIYTAVQALKEE